MRTFLVFIPFIHTTYIEIPIRRYKIVQTGPKTQFGGVKKGLFNVLYQVSIEAMVKGVLTTLINSGRAMARSRFGVFLMQMSILEKITLMQQSIIMVLE